MRNDSLWCLLLLLALPGLQYRHRNDPTMGNSNDAVLGLTVPLWFWKPAAMVSQAKAAKAMAEADLKAMRAGTAADLAGWPIASWS